MNREPKGLPYQTTSHARRILTFWFEIVSGGLLWSICDLAKGEVFAPENGPFRESRTPQTGVCATRVYF